MNSAFSNAALQIRKFSTRAITSSFAPCNEDHDVTPPWWRGTEPASVSLKITPENWRRSWLGPAALAATTETRVGGCPLAGPSRRRLWHRRPNAELSQSMTTTFNFRIDTKLLAAARKAAQLDHEDVGAVVA
jgi:hypothetical protein